MGQKKKIRKGDGIGLSDLFRSTDSDVLSYGTCCTHIYEAAGYRANVGLLLRMYVHTYMQGSTRYFDVTLMNEAM